MAAPTVVGTPTATYYGDPLSNTPGASATHVVAMNAGQPGGSVQTYSATWDGNAMSGTSRLWDTNFSALTLYTYGTPGTGAKNFDHASSGGNHNGAAACTLAGSTGVSAVSGNDGTSAAASMTIASNTNSIVIASLYIKGTATVVAGADETILVQYTEDGATVALLSKAGAASVSFAPTWTGSASWGMAGTSVEGSVSGPTIDTQPTAQTSTINNGTAAATFTVAATTSGGAMTQQWQFEDSVGAGTYTNITNGGIYSGATTTTLVITPTTKTGITGRRVRCNVTDSNGTTTTNAVALTVYTGFQFTSSTSAVTNGSGVATVTWTDDRPGSALGNGGFVKHIATSGTAVSRSSARPT
jgi:hypothetical protein